MPNQLKITSYYESSAWIVESEVTIDSDEDFPRKIFLWTLDTDGSLKDFQQIGHVDQVARYPEYDSNRTSNFGVHLVRHDKSRQKVDSEEARDSVIKVLKIAFDTLTTGYEEESTPIEEIYPI